MPRTYLPYGPPTLLITLYDKCLNKNAVFQRNLVLYKVRKTAMRCRLLVGFILSIHQAWLYRDEVRLNLSVESIA